MFKTTQELQDFILWAKEAKIKSFKIGQTEVQFSDIAFLEDLQLPAPFKGTGEEKNTSKTLVDTAEAEDDEALLMWSAKG